MSYRLFRRGLGTWRPRQSVCRNRTHSTRASRRQYCAALTAVSFICCATRKLNQRRGRGARRTTGHPSGINPLAQRAGGALAVPLTAVGDERSAGRILIAYTRIVGSRAKDVALHRSDWHNYYCDNRDSDIFLYSHDKRLHKCRIAVYSACSIPNFSTFGSVEYGKLYLNYLASSLEQAISQLVASVHNYRSPCRRRYIFISACFSIARSS